MLTEQEKREYYNAFVNKDSEYEGIFYVGMVTTGIFCRPTCSARKPKYENCEFYSTAQEALLASYRPCKRCHPLSYPGQASELVKTLIEAVEAEPDKRWKDADFRALSVDASTARRQFKKRFKMTFVAYARARRLGLAMKVIRRGHSVISAQLTAGYDSDSGFRDAFSRMMGTVPSAFDRDVLKVAWIDTPLGSMITVADNRALHLLEFVDRRGLEREIERLRQKTGMGIIPGHTRITHSIEAEIRAYFAGTLREFNISLAYAGSDFQKTVWMALQKIPYGETCSYADLARSLGQPKAFRAVARANGSNQLALIIPCHRIVNTNGELGGYSGGRARKTWLIEHEKKNLRNIGYSG